jgi:amino acid adenylation domain-containing protein
MSKIILTTVGSAGSIIPFIRMGKALRGRGHEVSLISNCCYEGMAREAGLEFSAVDDPVECEAHLRESGMLNEPRGFVPFYEKYFLPGVLKECRLIERLHRPRETILVARSQPGIAALLAAEKLGLPVVSIFLAPFDAQVIPVFEQLVDETFRGVINDHRVSLGLPQIGRWRYWLPSAHSGLGLWPEWFALRDSNLPVPIMANGFVLPEAEGEVSSALPEAVREMIGSGQRPILVTGGTGLFFGKEMFAVCLEACRKLAVPVLLVSRYREQVPDDLPPGVHWYEQLPFEQVVSHLRLIIHHGGIGTMSQAMAGGVPQIIMGIGMDRPDNALCLSRLGAGEHVPPAQWRPEVLVESIRRLSTPEVIKRCQELALRVAGDKGVINACQVIESCLSKGQAVGIFQATALPIPPTSEAQPSALDRDVQSSVGKLSKEKRALLGAWLQKRKGERPAIARLERVEGSGEFPLSFAQERLWFLEQLMPGGVAYNMTEARRIRGALELEALARAINEIVRRHEALRTKFAERAGLPVQVVVGEQVMGVEVVNLESLAKEERERRIRELTDEEGARPFDLVKGPLLRVSLVRLGAREHVLLFAMHHIVSDGWSMGVLVEEFVKLYRAFSQGQPSPLAPLPIQYVDYAMWQRGWLSGEVLAKQLGYWKEKLAGVPVLDLPTDRPRPAMQNYEGAGERVIIGPELLAGLKELSRRQGVTLFITLSAAFKAWLHRYSGQADLAVGTPIANRNRGETEGLIGFFANTLVLRTSWEGDPTFRELLAREKETAMEAYEHQDVPFERLVAELQPERDLSRNPLFQVMFVLQNLPKTAGKLPELEVEVVELESRTAKFDLWLTLAETEAGLSGRIEYAKDLFEGATLRRWLGHWERLLAEVVSDPGRKLSELEILSREERVQLLEEWNETRVEYEPAKCIHQLFEEQAEKTPDAVAVVYEKEALSYGELNRRANQLAHYLRRSGVGPESLVGICLERSLEMVMGLLGILKAGGAYVPLDPEHPAERLKFMMEEAVLPVLLTQEQWLGRLPEHPAQVICLDRDWPAIAGEAAGNPADQTVPASPAYVIYTSGSTGRPKGVINTHEGLYNRLQWMQAEYRLTAADRVLQKTPYGFDVSVWEFFWPLLSGASLVMARPGGHREPEYLMEIISREQITTLHFVPSMLQVFLEGAGWERCSGLKRVICSGEVLSRALQDRFFERLKAELHNLYGPTEAAIDVTYWKCEPASDPRTVPIGKPIANTRIYLLDDRQQLAPAGVPGELHIAGVGLARGYGRQPELTAERFIPDPYSSEPGGRLYRTGDMARHLPDGSIEYLNRRDHQVKVRGIRIELGEIEAVLEQHPAVQQSVVMVREDGPGGQRLAGYVVAKMDPARERIFAELKGAQVAEWESVFEETYQRSPEPADSRINLAGWNSSFTGEPIAAAEMEEWLAETLANVRRLHPQRVLEIGCGTGMILLGLAAEYAEYWATDISQGALDYVRGRLEPAGLDPQRVHLLHRPADNFEGINGGTFDCVILNSVAQYFPDAEYLSRVLAGAVHAVADGGCVFLGDIRSLALLEVFHTAVEVHKATGTLSVGELQQRIASQLTRENELVIDPGFFFELQRRLTRIGHVEITPKGTRACNELTQFRYHVVLHVGAGPELVAPEQWLEGEPHWTLQTLRQLLQAQQPKEVGLRGLANRHVRREVLMEKHVRNGEATRPVKELVEALHQESVEGVAPWELYELGRELNYEVETSWAGHGKEGTLAAVFWRKPLISNGKVRAKFEGELVEEHLWREYVNNPLHNKLAAQLAPVLKAYLKGKLPDYMVPAFLVVLKEMPLTANGKVDRRALPVPEAGRMGLAEGYVGPRNDTEAKLAGIWGEVLGLEPVGIHDNFFELGGHSLLAVQVITRVRNVFKVELPLKSLFAAPTVATLSEQLEALADGGAGLTIPQIRRAKRDQPLPLSYAQEQFWLADQLYPNSTIANMTGASRMSGPIQVEAWERTINEVVRRHEILRTTFATNASGEPVQVIHEPKWERLPVVDLVELPERERELTARELIREESGRPFDLSRGPLVRASLLRLDAANQVIWYTLHHIISDGWSMGVLNREIGVLYEAFASGGSSPLPELPIQYGDYAVWQREWLQRGVLEKQLNYWKEQLAGLSPLQLLADHPRAKLRNFNGTTYHLRLGSEMAAGLRDLSQREGVTLFMTLLAGFQVLLSRYTGQEDIAVGSPIAYRNRGEIEPLIGSFANVLVMRMDLSREPTISELLQRVKAMALEAYAHQDLPFSKLVAELQPERDLNRNPLVQVIFGLQNTPDEGLELQGVKLQTFGGVEVVREYDLFVQFQENKRGITGSILYNTDLFESGTIARMTTHLERVLAGFIKNPGQRLSEVDLLSEAEREQLVVGWNSAQTEYSGEKCLPELFEEQAKRRPEAAAVGYENEHLTYDELNRKANQLASELGELGVGPEVRVGICLERSAEMIVGFLGVLKAGGVYVPLDPDYPQEQLAFLLKDAGITILLTQERLRPSPPVDNVAVICLDQRRATADEERQRNLNVKIIPESLAYMSYVLGPNGRFHGIGVPHVALSRLCNGGNAFDFGPDDNVAQISPVWCGLSNFEIWGALAHGSRLTGIRENPARSPAELIASLRTSRITALFLPTSSFNQLAHKDPSFGCGIRQIVLVGGGPELESVQKVLQSGASPKLLHLYGEIESGVFGVAGSVDLSGNASVIRPISNTRTYILDPSGNPTPIGVPGELHLSDNLVWGGVSQPAWTAQYFIPDSFSQEPGRRLYRTGDRVRLMPDGSIEFLKPGGRQVYLHGVRSDLDRIEMVLGAESDVEECFLVIRKTKSWETRLLAYIVSERDLSPEELRERLAKTLPAHLLPDTYIFLSSLPLDASGQIDEGKLNNIEVIDPELIKRWEDQLRLLPEVRDVAVVVKKKNDKLPALHLSDLLQKWNEGAVASEAPSTPPARSVELEESGLRQLAFCSGGPLKKPEHAPKTLAEALIRTATEHPNDGILYVQAVGQPEDFQSYDSLLKEARSMLAGLQARGLKPGDKVILQIEVLRDHFTAFWACVLGGIIPVTVAVAPSYQEANGVTNKLRGAWELLGRPWIITNHPLTQPLRGLERVWGVSGLRIEEAEELRRHSPASAIHQSDPAAPVFFQLSSGSTGIPKCIQITHKGIIAHIHGSQRSNGYTQADVSLNWLPVDHVVPLLTYHLKDVYLGCRQAQVKTGLILYDPLAWLDLIETHRVTHSWSPNFGFKLLSDALSQSPDRNRDLACLRFLMNAGEQVTLPVVKEFLRGVSRFGVAPRVMQPAYGMAETCTAMIYANDFDEVRGVHRILKSSLKGVLKETGHDGADTVTFVDLGPPIAGVDIRIVDENNHLRPEGVIGRLQIRGDVVTPGYFKNDEANLEAFVGEGWFNSGDLGFILNGRLTVTGREKEMIIIRGANYYCHEIEDVVNQVEGVEPTFAAACSVDDPRSGLEGLAIFFVAIQAEEEINLIKKIRGRVATDLGISPTYVIPLERKDFPKTTSGKIQRSQLKSSLASGLFNGQIMHIDIQSENDRTIPDWFYEKVWRRKAGNCFLEEPVGGTYLMFVDKLGLGRDLARRLEGSDRYCIIVETGTEFRKLSKNTYSINGRAPEDYQKLLFSISKDGFVVNQILHLGTFDEYRGETVDLESLREAQSRGVYSLLFLVQALTKTQNGRFTQLLVISNHSQPVFPDDKIAYEKSTLLGLIKSIPLELSWLQCSHLDLSDGPDAMNTHKILRELCAIQREPEVTYRGDQRFIPFIARVNMLRQQNREVPIKPGGIYLVTGGLGGVGTCLAEFLIREYRVKLVIIGRTAFPERGEWLRRLGEQTTVAKRIANYLKIEAVGGEFMYDAIDVCDLAGLQRTVASAESRWNQRLSGIFHLAGEGGRGNQPGTAGERLITAEDLQSFELMFHAKVYGTWTLRRLLENYPGAAFIGFSSVYSVFGGAFLGSYSAANGFLDACCYYHGQHFSKVQTHCINWSIWEELGMSEQKPASAKQAAKSLGYRSLSKEQGWNSLLAGLARQRTGLIVGLDGQKCRGHRHVDDGAYQTQEVLVFFTGSEKVSTEKLKRVTVKDRFQTPCRCGFRQLPQMPLRQTGEPDQGKLLLMENSGERQIRGERVAPRNEVERQLAQIWQELLRVPEIGIDDDFFVLGGHSLLASRMVSAARNAFGVELTLTRVFQSPKLSSVAEIIEWSQKKNHAPIVTTGELVEGVI